MRSRSHSPQGVQKGVTAVFPAHGRAAYLMWGQIKSGTKETQNKRKACESSGRGRKGFLELRAIAQESQIFTDLCLVEAEGRTNHRLRWGGLGRSRNMKESAVYLRIIQKLLNYTQGCSNLTHPPDKTLEFKPTPEPHSRALGLVTHSSVGVSSQLKGS